ncbi:MAG: trp operon repressor [Treponema sp.]|nr:trp operon repressor [Treponema sp.]
MEENNSETELAVQQSMKEICHILTTSDEKLAYDFIECLFTPAERKDIANRWLLVKEIDKGTTQREIAKKFSMSLCKITRGSKELRKPDSAFRKILDNMSLSDSTR